MIQRALGASILGMVLVTGCSAEESAADDATASDDVVGLEDLGKLEQTLGLERGETAITDGALRAGACFRALIENRDGHEFRRYTNGAAYFAKKGWSVNSGDSRPVVCVDLFQGESEMRSLSGVVLDAIFRYDLGRITRSEILGTDSSRGRFLWAFERGEMMFEASTDDEKAITVRKRPHELDFATAPSISGRLLSLRLPAVDISYFQSPATAVEQVSVSGATAFLAYRYAHRGAEQSQVFDLASDPVGLFSKKAKKLGDGGVRATFLTFGHGGLWASEEYGGNMKTERISWHAPGATSERPPLAECTRDIVSGELPQAFACTGL